MKRLLRKHEAAHPRCEALATLAWSEAHTNLSVSRRLASQDEVQLHFLCTAGALHSNQKRKQSNGLLSFLSRVDKKDAYFVSGLRYICKYILTFIDTEPLLRADWSLSGQVRKGQCRLLLWHWFFHGIENGTSASRESTNRLGWVDRFAMHLDALPPRFWSRNSKTDTPP